MVIIQRHFLNRGNRINFPVLISGTYSYLGQAAASMSKMQTATM